MNIEALVRQNIEQNRQNLATYLEPYNLEFLARVATVIDFDAKVDEARYKKDAKAYQMNKVCKLIAELYLRDCADKINEQISNQTES